MYTPFYPDGWSDAPSTASPVTAAALAHMEAGIAAAADWRNVKDPAYGAVGDGNHDDTAAVQAALTDAGNAGGGVVFLPTGIYATTAPLVAPSGVTIQGSIGGTLEKTYYGSSVIKPLPTWAQGSAPAKGALVIGPASGGYEIAVRRVHMDLAYQTASADGISNGGSTNSVLLEDVIVTQATNGVSVGGGNTWRSHRVNCVDCENGFNGYGSDSEWVNCESIGAWGSGWTGTNGINTRLIGCRSEWSANYGYWIQADNTATGGMEMIGCSTDRSGKHGIYVQGSGYWPLLISNFQGRRDGATSTTAGYAALAVAAGCTNPVIVNGMTVFPGYDDTGQGNETPEYGINVNLGGAPSFVQVSNAYLHAMSAGVNGVLTSGRAIASRTGDWWVAGAITVAADTA